MDYRQKDIVIDADETAYSDIFSFNQEGVSEIGIEFTLDRTAGTLEPVVQVDDGDDDWTDYADLDAEFSDVGVLNASGKWQVVIPVYPRVRIKLISASSADQTLEIYTFSRLGSTGGGGDLPTGAATSAKQDTGNTSLSAIDSKLATLNSQTDGIEGSLTTLVSQTDGIEASLTSIAGNTALQTEIGHGSKAVTTAGTDLALAASTACRRVIIMARTSNTGVIAVGASGVDATLSTGDGVLLYPGDSIDFQIDNLADVYIDATVSGEGVRFTYFT